MFQDDKSVGPRHCTSDANGLACGSFDEVNKRNTPAADVRYNEIDRHRPLRANRLQTRSQRVCH